MKTLLSVTILLCLVLSTVCAAQEASDPVDAAELLQKGDRVSVQEGAGGFTLRVLLPSQLGIGGTSWTVHQVGQHVVVLHFKRKDVRPRHEEKRINRAAIVSVERTLSEGNESEEAAGE
jgi:hypothetical protein